MEFRKLMADEIDCRIARITDNGLQLLLYKDARCDMNVLDETVGAVNWMRSHTRDNANCIVSIWDDIKKQWISKEDTGVESNTEKEKGLASDSFKRACFNWGIGRELYTAPFIWFPEDKCNINNKKCYDRFKVISINYKGNIISSIVILNEKTKTEYIFPGNTYEKPVKKEASKKQNDKTISEAEVNNIVSELERTGLDDGLILDKYMVNTYQEMTVNQYNDCMNRFKKCTNRKE